METLPEFLLADSFEHPDAIFVVHTVFPRFVINLQNDELEWWEDFKGEDKEVATQEIAHWVERASNFYDNEIAKYE